ncbi:c-type cytochrome biogenesis protein CcmI [Litoribrevibacter euphylliae]|uniref:C-type cytochrome biogenesis protein CcmI n=1 Tax=Litoribrevibacter euphylliae TaxID=1834034 RepID=A0ABV7HBR7_9GAMM
MALLWVSIALMTALMLLFFILPVHFSRKSDDHLELSELNTRVFNEHLAQLEQDLSENIIDQQDFDAQKRELEDRYILDMDGLDSSSSKVSSKSSMVVLLVAGLISVVSSVAIYYKLGATEELEMAESLEKVKGLSEQELLARMEKQLESNPNNLEGQLLLARTYLTLGRSADAVKPLTTALELAEGAEGEAMISAQLAQAIYFSDPSFIPEKAEALIARSLELDPQEPTALGVSGIFAFEQGKYELAIQQWQKILALIEEGPNAESLRQGIKTARAKLAEQNGEAPAASLTASDSEPVVIKVAVGVSDEVRDAFDPATRVFVYARHATGPKMPLSIQSLNLDALPVSLQLDDSTSMGGMAKLSDAETVQVVARISVSGSAMPSEGDLQVMSKPIDLTAVPEVVVLELKK